ncbi:MAG: hexitol phosphatase HxpB [Chitinophagaceae bacterium]|nr:hexitol phosphatase HxpB [Chitinophagaceae bacterium]
MIDTVIFDMDGLLLDTEPLWSKSMLRIAERHHIPIQAQQFKETTGLKIHEVVAYWAIKYPWQGASVETVSEEIVDDIIELSKAEARVMPGAIALLDTLKTKGYKLGVATSSPTRMLYALIEHFEIKDYFSELSSADTVGFGKPHPAVFLHCAAQLGSNPLTCIVFEDSFNGIIAAKAARMRVIAVPDALHYHDARFAAADKKVRSLEVIDVAKDFS